MKLKRDPDFEDRPSGAGPPLVIVPAEPLQEQSPAASIEGTDDSTGDLYRRYYPLLAYLASQRFRVPEDDVKPLVHEVFVSYLRDRSRVTDPRAWLVGATCNRCRFYWRTRGRHTATVSEFDEAEITCDPADVAARVDLAAALRRLSPRCREVLRLRFEEDYSSAALAEHFDTTPDYAKKMVYRCAAEIREMLAGHRRR